MAILPNGDFFNGVHSFSFEANGTVGELIGFSNNGETIWHVFRYKLDYFVS